MRVIVDEELCESNGVCAGLAPSVFELRDDDVLYVLDETPIESFRQTLQLAVQRCPRQAIRLES